MKHKRNVILSDSKAGLIAILGGGLDNYLVQSIWDQVNKADKEICLQWIPGHVGIVGKEEAYKKVGIGCFDEEPLNIPIT